MIMPFDAQSLFPLSILEDPQCISAAQLLQLPYLGRYPVLIFDLLQVFGKARRKDYARYERSPRVGGPAQEYAPAAPLPNCKVHKQDKSD